MPTPIDPTVKEKSRAFTQAILDDFEKNKDVMSPEIAEAKGAACLWLAFQSVLAGYTEQGLLFSVDDIDRAISQAVSNAGYIH